MDLYMILHDPGGWWLLFFFWYGFSKIQKILEIYGSFQKTHDPWAIPKILDFEAAHGQLMALSARWFRRFLRLKPTWMLSG